MKISVVLATFNGQRYLPAQLESLAGQSRLPDELVVGDDGSTDETRDILEDFAQQAPFEVRWSKNPERLGYANNFLQTAKKVRGDWVAFCDQDDVWLPAKLERLEAHVMTHQGRDPLCMVVHDCQVVDAELKPLDGQRFPGIDRTHTVPRNGLPGFSVHPGMAKMVRAPIVTEFDTRNRPRSFQARDGALTHDKWTNTLANALGETRFTNEKLALYRRHGANASVLAGTHSWAWHILRSLKVEAGVYRFHSEVALEIAAHHTRLAARADSRAKLVENAQKYRHLAELLTHRSGLHAAESSLAQRLSSLYRLAREGGYWGDRFSAQGRNAFCKDAVVAMLGNKRVRPLADWADSTG